MLITFEPLHESHFPLLLTWLGTNHVKKWYDPDVTYTMNLIWEKYGTYCKGYKLESGQQKAIQAFIIYIDKMPVGYIQIYNAYDFPRSKPLLDLPSNLGAIDMFIGEGDSIGKGLGSKVILKFRELHGHPYAHIFVDPDAHNIAAIKCYENAGFKKVAEQNTGEVWMIWESPCI